LRIVHWSWHFLYGSEIIVELGSMGSQLIV
jgi:hypothetical protein